MGSHGQNEHHVMPLKLYFNVFAVLIFLTVVTVVTAKYTDFGSLNGLIAFVIATVKAGLVMAFFMHLKYDERIYRYIIGTSFAFVLLLFIVCVIDIATRIVQQSTL